jgi:voltage-gated potassium channel
MSESLSERYESRSDVFLIPLGFVFLGVYAFQVALQPGVEIQTWLTLVLDVTYWIFALDLVVRLFVARRELVKAPSLFSFLKRNAISIAAVIFPALRSLRVLRVLVAIRGLAPLVRTKSSKVLFMVLVTYPLALFTSAVAVLDAERGVAGSNINNFGDSLWWAFVTVTTVGYGDHYPVTGEGRFAAAFLMVFGIAMFSALAGVLASWILRSDQRN